MRALPSDVQDVILEYAKAAKEAADKKEQGPSALFKGLLKGPSELFKGILETYVPYEEQVWQVCCHRERTRLAGPFSYYYCPSHASPIPVPAPALRRCLPA